MTRHCRRRKVLSEGWKMEEEEELQEEKEKELQEEKEKEKEGKEMTEEKWKGGKGRWKERMTQPETMAKRCF